MKLSRALVNRLNTLCIRQYSTIQLPFDLPIGRNGVFWIPAAEQTAPKQVAPKYIYKPSLEDAHDLLNDLVKRGVVQESLLEELYGDEHPDLESLIAERIPSYLWDPSLWDIEDAFQFAIHGYTHPVGTPTIINPDLTVNQLFGNQDVIFLYQNAVADSSEMKSFYAPSQFVVSMIKSAEKEICISVYGMHENGKWNQFTSIISECLDAKNDLNVKIVVHPNKSSNTIFENLASIEQEPKNKGRILVKYVVGAKTDGVGSNGSQHSTLWIADGKIAYEGSLNISQSAFTTNMENGTGFKNKSIVKQIQKAFDIIWKSATSIQLSDYYCKIIYGKIINI